MKLWPIFLLYTLAHSLHLNNRYTCPANSLSTLPQTPTTITHLKSYKTPQSQDKTASLLVYKLRAKRFFLRQYIRLYGFFLKYYFYFKKRQFLNSVSRFFDRFKKESPQSANYPLVGNTWVLEFTEKLDLPNLNNFKEQVEFLEGGTVVTSSGLKGTWWQDLGELMWKFPLKNGKDSYVYFNAQFYVNKFDNRPYMRRGVVFKDRQPGDWLPKNLFRPVVGTFTAYSL